MTFFVSIINSIFDLFFYPFQSFDPIYSLCAIAFGTSTVILPIFKFVSNQEAIKKTKSKIMGHLLEVGLFNNDIKIVLSAQKNMFKYNFIYMGHMIKPLLVAILPVTVILIQAGVRFEYRPLLPNETAIVKVKFTNTMGTEDLEATLTASEGVTVETPSLRISTDNAIFWRIKADKDGDFFIRFRSAKDDIKKRVVVGNRFVKLSPKRTKGGFVDSLFHQGDAPLPEGSGVEYIEVSYPGMTLPIFGLDGYWLALFFIFSLLFGFLLLKPFNVKI